MECGLKTIPVRCLYNHCQNRGACYVDLLRNLTQCVCPSGRNELFFFFIISKYFFKALPVINVNIQLMNVNQVHVQIIVTVLIYQIVIHVFVV